MTAYRTDRTVRVSYALDEADWVSHLDPGRARRLAVALGSAFGTYAISGTLLWMTNRPAYAATVLAIVGALMLWTLRSAFKKPNPKRTLAQHWDDRRHRDLVADDAAFEVRDRLGGSRLTWEHVVHWTESVDHFYVYPNAHSFHVVPKRAFTSGEGETLFRQLLADHVPPGGEARIAGRQRSTAWPIIATMAVMVLVGVGVGEAVVRLISMVEL